MIESRSACTELLFNLFQFLSSFIQVEFFDTFVDEIMKAPATFELRGKRPMEFLTAQKNQMEQKYKGVYGQATRSERRRRRPFAVRNV